MPPSLKKVIVRRLTGDLLPGYLPPGGFIVADVADPNGRAVDLLDLDGHSLLIPLRDIKLICFVREFNREDTVNPERLTRNAFLSRPRAQGLWVRLTFPNGDQLEGLAPQDTTLLDGLYEDAGLFLTPPDDRANTHRVYVPRPAIASLELLAVIGAPVRTKPASRPRLHDQQSLFTPDRP